MRARARPRRCVVDRLLVPVAPVEQVAEVVVRAERRGGEVVLERKLERVLEQRERLLGAAAAARDQALRVQRLREDLRQPERLGDLDRGVDPLRGELDLALEEVQAAELGGERREVLVGLVAGEHVERALHPLERLLELPGPPLDLAEPRRDPRGRMRRSLRLVQLERALEVRRAASARPACPRGRAGPLAQRRLDERIVG